jgi:DNA-directed RNA polymerase subunit RPC12/RpoP
MKTATLSGVRMAEWELKCVNCNQNFTQSIIADTLSNYYLPVRPVFPEEGAEFECPHCGFKAVYQRTDLTYKD